MDCCLISYIYALLDPRTREIRYIGKTNTPLRRLNHHKMCWGSKGYTRNWLQQLKSLQISSKMIILEVVPRDTWQEKEKYYIKFYRDSGCNLTNIQEGGNAVEFTNEIRGKISKKLKGRTGKRPSDEGIERIKQANTGLKKNFTEGHKLKLADSNKRRAQKPHFKDDRKKQQTKLWQDPNYAFRMNSKKVGNQNHASNYKLITPDGDVILVNNLSKYCREHNLNYNTLSKCSLRIVNSPESKTKEGWQCIKL